MDGRQHQYHQCKYGETEFTLPLFIPISISHKKPLLLYAQDTQKKADNLPMNLYVIFYHIKVKRCYRLYIICYFINI